MVIDDVYSFSGLASKEAMSCENKILDLVVELNRGIHDAQVSDEGTTGSLGAAIFLTQARVILRVTKMIVLDTQRIITNL